MNRRQEAYSEIRSLILSGELEVGKPTSERELAERLDGMSRTPVREALAVLSLEGLVEQAPQRGVWVREVTRDEALAEVRLLGGLEPLFVGELAKEPNPDAAKRLREIVDNPPPEDGHGFALADTRFHCDLARLAGFDNGVQPVRSARDKIHLYRCSRGGLEETDRKGIADESRRIIDFIEGGNAAGAIDALMECLGSTTQSL